MIEATSVAEAWEEFSRTAGVFDVSEEIAGTAQFSFYAGAIAMLRLACVYDPDTPGHVVAGRLNALRDECHAYVEFVQGVANDG